MTKDFMGMKLEIVIPTEGQISKKVKELQDMLDKHKLSIGIDLSKDALAGLELLGKNTKEFGDKTKKSKEQFEDLGDTLEKVGKRTKEVFKLDSKGNLKKQITEIEEEFGQLLRIYEKVDKKGNLKVSGSERVINYEKQKQALDALNASQLKMLQSLEKFKNFPQLKNQIEQIERSIKGLDLTNITKTNVQQIKNEIDALNSLHKKINEISKQSTKLNTKEQSVLNLQNKVGSLAPSKGTDILTHQLERYKRIIAEFQKQNQLGIEIKPEAIDKLQNLENRIKRLHETTKKSQQDSKGFDFKQYEAFDKLNPKITEVRNKQEYYNKSLLEGHKLIKTLTQETDNYIKVTQQLRKGSVHKDIGVYIDKNTGQMFKFNEALRDGTTRSWGLGEAIYTAGTKAMIWSSVMGTFYTFLNLLQQIPTTIIEIDTRLTEMSKVMDNSTNFPAFMGDLTQSANAYGRTLTETQDAVIEFAKAGWEGEQAISLANTALIGANVSLMKTSEVATFVTGVMSQFNVEFEDATRIIDKINQVDNESSATFQGIAQGLLKSGETAQQFGVDLDTLIGYITAVQTATRESGNQIGRKFAA